MPPVIPGRFTAHHDESFVIFIIGMRVNRLRAVRKWLPVVRAMGPMLSSLYAHPEKGFLGGEFLLMWRGITHIQYWRSFDDLERFARDPADPHLPAWKAFNQAIGSDGTVGIYHETYLVQAGNYETLYGNMPRFGLAAATQHLPAVGRRETARRRLGGEGEPAVASPPRAGD